VPCGYSCRLHVTPPTSNSLLFIFPLFFVLEKFLMLTSKPMKAQSDQMLLRIWPLTVCKETGQCQRD